MRNLDRLASPTLYWTLPTLFLLHDAEELVTMPAWVAEHHEVLEAALSTLGLERLAAALPVTTAQMAWAIAVIAVIFLVVTAGIVARPHSAAWRALYGGLLGVFLLHAGTHVAQTLWFGAYTPGVVTAVLLVAPGSLLLGRRLLRLGAIGLVPSVVTSCAALPLFPLAAALAFEISAWLTAL